MTSRKQKAFIFDIDGTVADGRHRQHFLSSKPKNWPAYQKGAPHDARWDGMHAIFNALKATAGYDYEEGGICGSYRTPVNHRILFVSGRSEDERLVTEDWLERNEFTGYYKLLMRPSKDYRADDIIKEEILDRDILPFYDVVAVFDDRPRVVKMWKRRGLYVLTADQREEMTEF
jgi:hypothetical protein